LDLAAVGIHPVTVLVTHIVVLALLTVWWNSDALVEVEGNDPGEVEAVPAVPADELFGGDARGGAVVRYTGASAVILAPALPPPGWVMVVATGQESHRIGPRMGIFLAIGARNLSVGERAQ
jgi:hypothetical protein